MSEYSNQIRHVHSRVRDRREDMSQVTTLGAAFAGWVNRHQLDVMPPSEYLDNTRLTPGPRRSCWIVNSRVFDIAPLHARG